MYIGILINFPWAHSIFQNPHYNILVSHLQRICSRNHIPNSFFLSLVLILATWNINNKHIVTELVLLFVWAGSLELLLLCLHLLRYRISEFCHKAVSYRAGNGTQDLGHARQALCQLQHSPSYKLAFCKTFSLFQKLHSLASNSHLFLLKNFTQVLKLGHSVTNRFFELTCNNLESQSFGLYSQPSSAPDTSLTPGQTVSKDKLTAAFVWWLQGILAKSVF